MNWFLKNKINSAIKKPVTVLYIKEFLIMLLSKVIFFEPIE